MSRAADILELYQEGLNDHKIAEILGLYPYDVWKFRSVRRIPANWERHAGRSAYKITDLRSGGTFFGNAEQCAEWMNSTVKSLRSTCCYQRRYGFRGKRARYAVERLEGRA